MGSSDIEVQSGETKSLPDHLDYLELVAHIRSPISAMAPPLAYRGAPSMGAEGVKALSSVQSKRHSLGKVARAFSMVANLCRGYPPCRGPACKPQEPPGFGMSRDNIPGNRAMAS